MVPNDVYKAFMEAGTDWADKHAASELRAATAKTVRAKIAMEYQQNTDCSMTMALEHALASSSYVSVLHEVAEASKAANRAKVKYEATKALFEAQRTAAASERAAMGAAT